MMKLEHANLTVQSVDDAIRFLGAAFTDSRIRGEGTLRDGRGRWVHFGNDEFYIALQENHEPGGRQDVTYFNDGINHIGFVVEDLDALMERLVTAGFDLSENSVMNHPYRRRAYYFDNNGIEWEFVGYASDRMEERNDYSI